MAVATEALPGNAHPHDAPPMRGHARRPTILRRAPDVAAVAAGVGLGASVALPLTHASGAALRAPGGVATLAGDVTGMAGTYLLLVMVLLAGRIPSLESVLGQDRLIRWHRRLSSAPLVLLGAHGVFTVLGFAEAAHVGFLSETGSLVTTMAWIFASVVAYAMFVGIAVMSIRAARRRMSYDTWWVIHLYTYLALAFSLPHQIVDGTDFVGRPLVQAAWIALWAATAGAVIVYRIGLPVYRSLRHRLEVVDVHPEAPGVFSVVVRGRRLDRLPLAGGQYLQWRFLTRRLWWHAHPFSLSAMPTGPFMRVTIKVAGDATAQMAELRPGTRVAIEGPYGAFTPDSRVGAKALLVGAGVGITPLRALAEDMPDEVDIVVVQRASTDEALLFPTELRELVEARGGRVLELVGPRSRHRLDDPDHLARLVPDVAERDLYVCGPEEFSAGVVSAARAAGVAPRAVHFESFEF